MKKVIKYLYFSFFLSLFVSFATQLWGAESAPASARDAELALVSPEFLRILELRANVISNAIELSIAHNAYSGSCLEILQNRERIKRIEQQAYVALNKAEAAYLMASKRTQSKLDITESTLCNLVCRKLGTQNLLSYGKIKKIVQDNVVKSELPASVRKNLSLMMQNAAPLEALFEIKDDCLRPEFIMYTTCVQGFYTKKALELGLPDKKLFLESLDHSDNLVQIFKCLCMAKVRNIIETAYNADILENTQQGRHLSKAIEEFRKRNASAIAKERQKVYVRLLSIEEIKSLMISEYTRALSPVLQERILSLVNQENAATLTHYAFIWEAKCRIAGEHFGSLFIDSAAEIEYLRKTFSGLDPKSVQAGANAENIWPNLVSRLRDCGFEMLIKEEAPQAARGSDKKSAQKSRELPAMAKELIAEEDARKRRQAQLRAAHERAAEERRLEAERKAQAAYKAEKKKKKKTKPQHAQPEEALSPEQSYAPESHEVKELEQKDLVPEKPAQDPLVTPLAPQAAAAAEPEAPAEREEDDDDEEMCELDVAEQLSIQAQLELPNSTDKIYKEYNCIWDLSRDATGGYQCKIFLHPEIAGSGENFLANLDYSRLAKYKNPRDNNHAFSNLVEKEFGSLGNVVERKETGSGWIVMRITFPGTITWMGHKMSDACQLRPNGTFEFVIMKKDMNPESYARCVHRFFRPNK